MFTQAFSQAPNTFPSHMSIFTSRYPTDHWLNWDASDLTPAIAILPEILKRHGYATAAFTGFSDTLELSRRFITSRAFEAFDRQLQNIELKELPRQLVQWLFEHHDEPFFLFLHGYDAHEPHVLPISYNANRFDPTYQGRLSSTTLDLAGASSQSVAELERALFEALTVESYLKQVQQVMVDGRVPRRDLEHMQAVYDAQIFSLDRGLEQLINVLANLQLMDRTVLVILSDHGQEFGEHGHYATHDQCCYDELTRIVLIVRDPRMSRRGIRVHRIVQGVDVMPTILDLLDLPIPSTAVGSSLVPLLRSGDTATREEVAVSAWPGMRAIRTKTWKLIDVTGGAKILYHLTKDPHEQHNVIDRYPEIVARLQAQLDARMPARETAPTPVENPVRQMQGHGYW